jgi:transposase-like protein
VSLVPAGSFRQLEEIMAERSLTVDHVTIRRWVHRGDH